MGHATDLKVRAVKKVKLSAKGTTDPDGDKLTYRWWQYTDAGTYKGMVEIRNNGKKKACFKIPKDASKGKTINMISLPYTFKNKKSCLTL